jgi:myo-inositol 2-dehydrogenase / D-chiro-inositol 1-dehydrogenase
MPDARARAQARGVQPYREVEELLDAGGFEAALVAAPSSRHVEIIKTLADAGIPVLCEEPLGVDPVESREAGRIMDRAGLALMVGYWRRFVPVLVELQERIAAGELGSLSLVSCFRWDERPQAADLRAASGGPFMSMGMHELDMTRWLTGQEIASAAGFASPVGVDPPVDGDAESVAAVLRLSQGALATVSLGRHFAPGDACRVQIVGTMGAEDVPFLWPPEGERVFLAALKAQAEAFADAVRGAEPVGATTEDAAKALEAAATVSSAISKSG